MLASCVAAAQHNRDGASNTQRGWRFRARPVGDHVPTWRFEPHGAVEMRHREPTP